MISILLLLATAVFAQNPPCPLEPISQEASPIAENVVTEDPPITPGHGKALPIDQLPDHVSAPKGQISLYADFADVRGGHVVLYLVNRTEEKLTLWNQDHDLYVKLEAQIEGTWRRAQGHTSSWCGNSYMQTTLEPGEFFRFLGLYPRAGAPADLRYRLPAVPDIHPELISNIGAGRVSPEAIEARRCDALAARTSRDFKALLRDGARRMLQR